MYDNLTKDDIKKMQEEIEYRKLVVRKEALEAVKEARAQGDLSENFEYKAAKQDKNRNESRIRYLERMLKHAQIVSDESKADEVGINNTVEVYFEEDDETETYRLVTSVRGNSLQGLISIESPLGKAIQGHKVGDRVFVNTNGNAGYYVKIQKIENTTDDSEDTDQTEDAGKYKFGFSVIDMQNPYFITLEEAAQQIVEKEECTMLVKDPASDADTQAEQIREMINEGINAIFLCPVDWEKITPSLQALQDAGVKIINIDSQVKDTDYIDAYVGSDNTEAGKLCGNDLIEKYPDGGTVAILEATTQNSVNDRITGFEQAVAKAEKGFEVVAREDTNGTFDSALEAAKKILEEQPDVTAIMCGNDQMAVAAKTALNLVNNDQTVVYSVDGSPDIKKELMKADSQIAGTVAQSPINIGKKAVDIALNVLDGKDFEAETAIDVFMINKDNVEMYGADGWQ